MITLPRTLMGLIAMIGALLLMAPIAGAAEPTLSDIAGCNQQAAQKTGASALPAPPGARGPDVAKRAPDDSRQPRELPARGGIPVAGAPGASPKPPTDTGAAPGEKTDPTGAVITQSPDPLLKGMDAGKADDPAYRAAYRDCMRARQAR
jgi:hypothetical protein